MSTSLIPDSEVVLDPKSTILVVVDVQNWFAKPGGEFYDAKDQGERDRTNSMVGKLESFLRKCRQEGLRIIFLQTVRAIDDPAFKAWGTKPRVIGGTWDASIIDELTPLDDEVIVQKSSNDCFIKPDMEDVLQKYGIKPFEAKIIITGGNIGTCAYTAIIGFSQRNYYTVVPIDCTYGLKESEERVIKQLSTGAYNYNVALTYSGRIRFELTSDSTRT